MQVALGEADRGDLDGADQTKVEAGGLLECLLNSANGVVVAQREQLYTRGSRGSDNRAWRERPVGVQGMALKVESWSGGRQVSLGAPRGRRSPGR